MKRRECLHNLAGLGLLPLATAMASPQSTLLQRSIPSTGEKIPAIGVGTWQTFDVGSSDADRKEVKDVVARMVSEGATVIDSSPMYGNSEQVVGDLSTSLAVNDKLFIATKVWTSGEAEGIRQMQQSFSLLKRSKIDLMQVHNLVDWEIHMKTLRKWKSEGKIRYIGLTHYTDSIHKTIADIIRKNEIDFVQVNYNLLDTNAERDLFPVARDKGVAVIINRPFQEGALFQRVKGKPLPAIAADLRCESWAQYFLKFILSHPDVTCVVPGTSKVTHLLDNLKAGYGRLPDPRERQQMIDAVV